MKIDTSQKGQFGNFQILPTEGKKIIQQFMDYETKLLIVEEIPIQKGIGNSSQPIFTTTVDTNTGTIVSVIDRAKYIDYVDRVVVNKELQIKSVEQRTVNQKTGSEFIDYQLIDLTTRKVVVSGGCLAFSKEKLKSPIEKYKESLKSKKERDKFWTITYPKKSYQERVQYWEGSLRQFMRWQTESGYPEASIFSKKWLEENKKVEPQLEQIMEELLSNWGFCWDVAAIREALKK